MSCTAHILNTVLRHTFDDEYLAEQLPELQKSLKKVKAIVKFLKQSGLCNQLPHGVCQEVSTRWNSKVAMIKSLVTQYEDIESLLDSRGNTLMEDLNKAALKDVVNFLEPFKEASEKLEQDKQPTLPLVLLYQRKLKGHLTPVAADTRTISQLKKRAAQFLETKLQLEEIHYVATLLWPPFRQLRALKEAERTAVFSTVRQMMLGVPEVPSEQETGEECTSTKPPKRRLLDEFQDWHDHAETDIDDDELDSYLHAGGRSLTFRAALKALCWRGPAANADPQMNEQRGDLLGGEKSPATDVTCFLRQCCNSPDLREIIRDVVREEIRKLLPAATSPVTPSVAEIVREELQQALQPEVLTGAALEPPKLSYTAAIRRPPPPAHPYTAPPPRDIPDSSALNNRRLGRQMSGARPIDDRCVITAARPITSTGGARTDK
ncbi:hypothetical protein HPB47_014206 [Ixodes persulcatus]|uniref:Uncharacterized protein n=1 Tax=Ixodes persulcatus TaxID=34615 RepID=A0AC60R047_IXOPE|nr:hypothetical protein HPB47_014206 [Ixodes persulcatus]